MNSGRIEVGLNAVIIAVTDETPRIITLAGNPAALPTGRLDPALDRTLERALRRWVSEGTAIDLGYVEQLYTLGDRDRGTDLDVRLVTVAYVALVKERAATAQSGAVWRDWYGFFPWEDWREGRPAVIDTAIVPALDRWADEEGVSADREARQERSEILFGLGGSSWDIERVLERYELLWEIGFVPEAGIERLHDAIHGAPLVLDHRRIVAQALERIRGKIRYRPVVFELMPEVFTLTGLQRVVEALSGVRIHAQNFRRLLDRGGLVEKTARGEYRSTIRRAAASAGKVHPT